MRGMRGGLRAGMCLAVGWLSGCILTGCAGANVQVQAREAEKVTLRFAGYKVGEHKVEEIDRILDAYMEEQEDTIVVYEGIQDNYVEVMTNRIESGAVDDLFMISDQALTTYAQKGWYGTRIADLSGMELIDRYSPLIKKLFTVDGMIGAVPMNMSVAGLMANMDVLKACGISEMPQTYDTWVAAMRTVKEHGYTPMVHYQGNCASFNFLISGRAAAPFIEQGISQEGMTAIDVYEPAIREIYGLMDEGLFDREQALVETEARSYQKVLGEQFAAGGVAFAVIPSWCMNSFLEGQPKFAYQFGGLPVGDEGPLANVRASLMVAISNEGMQREKAEEFLDFMMRPEHIEDYAAHQDGLSPLDGASTENPLYIGILQLIEEGRLFSDTDSRIPFNLIKRLNHASAQMLQCEPIEQILEDFDKGVVDD